MGEWTRAVYLIDSKKRARSRRREKIASLRITNYYRRVYGRLWTQGGQIKGSYKHKTKCKDREKIKLAKRNTQQE